MYYMGEKICLSLCSYSSIETYMLISYKSQHHNWRTENGLIAIGAGKSWKNFIKWFHMKYSKMSLMSTEWMEQRRNIRLREESCPVDEKLLSAYLHSKYSILKTKKKPHTHQKNPLEIKKSLQWQHLCIMALQASIQITIYKVNYKYWT